MSTDDFLHGGGEMGLRMRELDWASTPLGPARDWPRSLKTAVRIMLTSRQAMFVWWGPELINLYNDAYRAIMAGKHPRGLSEPASVVWKEIWDDVGPRARSAMERNEGTYDEALQLIMERNGYPEETYYTFSYSPVPDDDGRPGGIICANTDDTLRIIGERRLALLGDLAARTADARTFEDACTRSAASLDSNPHDLPFAMIYLVDAERGRAVLTGTSGIASSHPAVPHTVLLGEQEDVDALWPLAEVVRSQNAVVTTLDERFGALPFGAWKRPPSQAVAIPIASSGAMGKRGVLVAALNPYRLFDDNYRGFIELVARQISASVGNAQAYEEERKRAEALVELDRAKTTFFSNVSHEFRTPLTLMLGPIEDILRQPGSENRELLTVVHRNALRLQKLVNTLLDFSRIEAGRMQAAYQETDIAALTADLASTFRSAVEKAGLRFVVETEAIRSPVYVDRELWEKIVLNLLSNAFKFTLEGEIALRLRQNADRVELTVTDTGSGIPADALPHIFERFHRVEGTLRRTHEGTGIGLALVQELVKLHGGTVGVTSVENEGTTFTVSFPTGSEHLPPDRVGAARALAPNPAGADLYVEEAAQWLPRDVAAAVEKSGRERIVLADDNADMREYVRHLLSKRYDVTACADGGAALEEIRRRPPDLVLTDVMMPVLDGFGLLAEIRRDPQLAALPVIMLSARAGEEATIEGIEAGADDYLVKPFTARELLARVGAHLGMAAIRREAQRVVEESRATLEMAMDAASLGAWELDIERGLMMGSERVRAIFGADSQESPSDVWFDHVHPEDWPRVEEEFAAALTGQAAYDTEFRVIVDDRVRWVRSKARLQNRDGRRVLSGIAEDVTVRKSAEEALRRSQELYREMADDAPVMSWMTDPDGVCTFLSRSWYEFTGQTPETGLGFGWLDATHPDDRAESERVFHESNRRNAHFRLEYRLRRADGEYCWAIDSAAPRIGPDGQFLGYIGSVVDISDRKQAEDALQASAEALREADRLKDEFLATLSHELRTPLTSILGWAHMLTTQPLTKNEQGLAFETIERSAKIQSALIEDVLDISRITSGKMRLQRQWHDPAAVVDAAVDTVRPAAEAKDITLRLEVDRGLDRIHVDPDRLQQILWNLLSNAIKFSPPHTTVEVTLRRQDSTVIFEVNDQGPGIDRSFLPHVFERFRQADSSARRVSAGLGIGLALVKELAQLHGGSVAVESEAGQGARFRIELPVVAPRDAGPADEVLADVPLAGVSVLFVDDSEDARILVEAMLRAKGANVSQAASVEEALALLDRISPDVVITDIAMPDRDGFDLLHHLRTRQKYNTIPVMALTAHTGRGDDNASTGFHRFLRKPIDAEELVSSVAQLTSGKRVDAPAE